jgi:HSP20 family molecular chaperone IbpA
MDSKKAKFTRTIGAFKVNNKKEIKTTNPEETNISFTYTFNEPLKELNSYTSDEMRLGGGGGIINSGGMGGGDGGISPRGFGNWGTSDEVVINPYVSDGTSFPGGWKKTERTDNINVYDFPYKGQTPDIKVPVYPLNIRTTKNTNTITTDDIKVDDNLYIKNSINVPNKIDKDLVSTSLPYNLRKNFNEDLLYDFAVAGYSEDRILIQLITNGIKIMLKKYEADDDLIGEEFDFICKGIKNVDLSEEIFVDSELYNLSSFEATLNNGILTIYVPRRKKSEQIIRKVINKGKGKVNLKILGE